MEEGKKVRFRIFLWDQFIRPFYLLLNLYQLQAILIALLIINFVVWKNITAFWILVIVLGVIFLFQMIKYYKSGEFMYNYRKYKSDKGQYGDYRKVTKILKKEKKITPDDIFDYNEVNTMNPSFSNGINELNQGEAFHE